MSDRYYTGTFEVTHSSFRPRVEETRPMTLVFHNVHPAVYEACYPPGITLKPPVLLHHAEIDEAQAEGIMAVYRATNRSAAVITLHGLHEMISERVSDASERKESSTINYAVRRLEALEGYAEAMGVELRTGGPRP